MTVGVARHLGIDLAEYDDRIRTFIPRYDEMLAAAAGVLASAPPAPRVVDLGIGTGALAARCIAIRPHAAITGIDSDPEILAAAGARLRRSAAELTLVRANFEAAPLPASDAIVASLSLHHVGSEVRKRRLYDRAFRAVSPGGIMVTADCMPAADGAIAAAQHALWRAHMRAHYDARTVARYFRAWAGEDVYMPLAREIALAERAGFAVEIVWRSGAFAVLAAIRRGDARRIARRH